MNYYVAMIKKEGFDTAQVCKNGHLINQFAETNPGHNEKFCSLCGAETITTCQACQASIRGYRHSSGVFSLAPYNPPHFCHNCGRSFPWTETGLSAARDMIADFEQLSVEERESLSKSLDDLIRETPATPTAVMRFKRLAAKAGSVAADGLKTIMIEIVSEAIKKQIWNT